MGSEMCIRDRKNHDVPKRLGLRPARTESAAVSRASSPGPAISRAGSASEAGSAGSVAVVEDVPDEIEGVKAHMPPSDEDLATLGERSSDGKGKGEGEGQGAEDGHRQDVEVSDTARRMQNLSSADLPRS